MITQAMCVDSKTDSKSASNKGYQQHLAVTPVKRHQLVSLTVCLQSYYILILLFLDFHSTIYKLCPV